MKLPHALWAWQSAIHESKVVKGLEDITWRSTVSYPSMPQNSSAVGDGVVVEVEVEVTVISEDVLEVTGMGLIVEESLDSDSVDEVLVVCSLAKVLETRTGLEEALLELELLRDEELTAELEETASHFPNPG
ncbi:hypothetical protein AA0120_g2035 [Alternaria tenuissima]|jgi:hypothetical protein|nr:hypothetical protein AA0120_g2035 [Alternaria tenuissima]